MGADADREDHNGVVRPSDPRIAVARDLREIADELHPRMQEQAEHLSNSRLMPGGAAMVALGNVANIEAWENRQQASERYANRGLAYTSVADEDPDEAWSAFQLLEFWSEQWRVEHNMEFEPAPHRPRPNVATEANFLRWALDWAWQHEPHWKEFAADVRRARIRCEDILHRGDRQELSRIVCDRCKKPDHLSDDDWEPPRLVVLRGSADDGTDDRWKCPRCKARFTPEETKRAHATMLRSAGAERWVHQSDAISVLRDQGRPERTVRQWLADGEGSAYCDPVTHEVWCWWPDLWRKHLATPTRKRAQTA